MAIFILILSSEFNLKCISECLGYITLVTTCGAVFIQISYSFLIPPHIRLQQIFF